MRHLGLSIAAWSILVGCHIEDNTLVLERPGAHARAAASAHRRMHARFEAADRIEQAIVLGDLERARADAHDLASLDEPDVLLTWRPYFDAIRDAARQIEAAASIADAAQRAAILGQRCASCHDAIGAFVVFSAEPRPLGGAGLAVQMHDHQWAAARMWAGLIGPSDDRWLAGAHALATAPLASVAQAVAPSTELDVDDVARVRRYADQALTAKPQQGARAALFGALLATCAHCHAALRDR